MTTQTLTAEERTITGRKVKALRRDGVIPGNIFGKDVKSYAVSVPSDAFRKVYEEAGETGIIELSVGKKTNPVLIANVQKHPVTGNTLHIDFRQVDLTKKITATVPVEIIGESPAEKSGLGTVVQQILELEVEALPTDLPENFEVDVTSLTEVDSAIYVKDLKFDKTKVTLDAEEDQIIAKVEPPQEEKEVVAETTEPEEGTEGAETPAEGKEAVKEEATETPAE